MLGKGMAYDSWKLVIVMVESEMTYDSWIFVSAMVGRGMTYDSWIFVRAGEEGVWHMTVDYSLQRWCRKELSMTVRDIKKQCEFGIVTQQFFLHNILFSVPQNIC